MIGVGGNLCQVVFQRLSIGIGQHLAHDVIPGAFAIGSWVCPFHTFLNSYDEEPQVGTVCNAQGQHVGMHVEQAVGGETGLGLNPDFLNGVVEGVNIAVKHVFKAIGTSMIAHGEQRGHPRYAIEGSTGLHFSGVGQIEGIAVGWKVPVVGDRHHLTHPSVDGLVESG